MGSRHESGQVAPDTNIVGRRSVLGGIAAIAGAAATLSTMDAAAATADTEVPSFLSFAGDPAAALPPIVPGATVKTIGLGDLAVYLAGGALGAPAPGMGTGLQGSDPPVRGPSAAAIAGGSICASLDMPVGSRLARVDIYGIGSLPNPYRLGVIQRDAPHAGTDLVVGQVQSGGGGATSGFTVLDPQATLARGERFTLWLTTSSFAAIPPPEWFIPHGAIYQYISSQPQLVLLDAPVRVYDSRPADPPGGVTKGKLLDGQTRNINGLLGTGVPAGAAAVLANLTAVNTSGGGWLSAYRAGTPFPGTTTLNWFQPGSVVANSAVVRLNGNGQCTIRAAGSADFFLDVFGYYL